MSYDYCVFIKNFSGSQHDYELSYTDGTTKTTKTIAVSNGDQGDEVLELEATMGKLRNILLDFYWIT